MTTAVVLYTTLGCHLCEQAHALLLQLQGEGMDLQVLPTEIADDETLMARYGIRIPVVARTDGAELGWPFDAGALRRFLEA